MKSSTLVLVAVLVLCFSVAFAENEKKNATQPTNATNVTENVTNVTMNMTNVTATNVTATNATTTNVTNVTTNMTDVFKNAKGKPKSF